MGIMISSILIIVFAATICFLDDWRESKLKRTFLKHEKMVVNAIMCATLCLIILVILIAPKSEMQYQYSFPIYSMQDNTQTTVGRYLTQTDLKYYYIANYKGGKKVYSVSSGEAYIVESNKETPKVEVYKLKPTSQNIFVKFLFAGLGNVEYKIIVPKGSVTTDFSVDLNN